jgi:hypothetical protein
MASKGPETPIRTPVLHLLGSEDGCVEPASARGQARYFSGGFEEATVGGSGHFPHLEKPGAVGPMILGWLGRARRNAGGPRPAGRAGASTAPQGSRAYSAARGRGAGTSRGAARSTA